MKQTRQAIVVYGNAGFARTLVKPFDYYGEVLRLEHDLITELVHIDDFRTLPAICRGRSWDIAFFCPSWYEDATGVIDAIRNVRKIYPDRHLVFLDSFDQTSSLFFGVLPSVDRYLKRLVLRDITAYQRPFIGGFQITDYLARHCKLKIDDWYVGSTIPDGLEHRLAPGWDVCALAPIEEASSMVEAVADCRSWAERDIDIHCRVSLDSAERRQWYYYYRHAVLDAFEPLKQQYAVIAEGNFLGTRERLSREAFQGELRRSRIVVSPFGWGETSIRDFEAIRFGCLLLKPSMSTVVVNPDIFVPYETYVPLGWDFADLVSKCHYYMTNPTEARRIVANAQQRYRQFFDNKEIVDIIVRAISPGTERGAQSVLSITQSTEAVDGNVMAMQPRALVTVAVGERFKEILQLTKPYFEHYAKRTGANFVVIEHCGYKNGKFAKLHLGELLNRYERILFVDVDAILLPTCPDLFRQSMPDDAVWAWVEPTDWWRDEWKRDPGMQKHFERTGIAGPWNRVFINTGVMLLSSVHSRLFEPTDEKLWDEFPDTEQFYINFRIAVTKTRVMDLGFRFNCNYNYFRQLGSGSRPHVIHPMGYGVEETMDLITQLRREYPVSKAQAWLVKVLSRIWPRTST